MNYPLIRHGGDLENAVRGYGGNADEWLDLSTGISPWHYPIPNFDNVIWRKLPPPLARLLTAASEYYCCDLSHIIATPGTQLAIRLIPTLVEPKQTVAIPLIGYQEHANSWKMAGHRVIRYQNVEQLVSLINQAKVDNAVVINPNNPTTELISPNTLVALANKLRGILITDEAFSDLDPSTSICMTLPNNKGNIVILKSIGKFFGLAGGRIGFAIGTHPIVNTLGQLCSPWSLSGPSVEIATKALSDTDWQVKQIKRITKYAKQQRLIISLLTSKKPVFRMSDQGLFFTIFSRNKPITTLHKYLAEQKIWTRLGDPLKVKDSDQARLELNWLRLSLAGDQIGILSNAIESITHNNYR